jgi:DNA-binding CsgD family transcriptional regulator
VALVERDVQLAVLGDGLAAAGEGAGSVVVVSAEAGGGKTALVTALAEGDGATRVLWGSCDDLVTPLPLAPFLEIARQAGPAVESAFASGSREAAMEALLDEIERRPHPVLVVVEDIHWADQASLDLILVLAGRVKRLPALVVLTVRSESATPETRRLLARAAGVRMDLPPLTHEGIAALAGDRAGWLEQLTGGNPFYVRELLEYGGRLPPTVREAVIARLAALPADTRDLIDLLAVVPGRVETRLLDRCRPGWEEAAEAAEASHVIVVDGHHVAFRHELTREAVEGEILRSRLRRLHAEVLEASLALGVPAGRIVHHADGAGDVRALLEAGPEAATDAATAGAHREAAAHLRRALDHAEQMEPARRAKLEAALSVEAWTTGLPGESLEAARRALAIHRDIGSEEDVAHDLRHEARARWFLGEGDEAERLVDEAIDILEHAHPQPVDELAVTCAYRALLAGIRWSAAVAADWSKRALELVEESTDTIRSRVTTDVGIVEYLHGERGPDLLLQALETAQRLDRHFDVVRAQVELAAGAVLRREYPAAAEWLDRADAFAHGHQVSTMEGAADAIRARISLERGEWGRAETLARAVVDNSEQVGFARLPAHVVLAHLRVRTGDPEAHETVEGAWERAAATHEAQRIAPAAAAAAEQAWLHDRPREAAERLGVAHQRAVESGVTRWIGETALWLHLMGALDDPSVPMEHGYRSMIGGAWTEAAEIWEEVGCPYEAALARVLSDEPDALLTALEVLDRLGATPLARMTRSRLRRLGVERIPRRPRASTLANPVGLTARQMDVLGLVAAGYTNAEIADRLYLSTRTVDHHVAAVLMKLGVPSRREAGVEARRLGLLT